jgi:hypothetical protein
MGNTVVIVCALYSAGSDYARCYNEHRLFVKVALLSEVAGPDAWLCEMPDGVGYEELKTVEKSMPLTVTQESLDRKCVASRKLSEPPQRKHVMVKEERRENG